MPKHLKTPNKNVKAKKKSATKKKMLILNWKFSIKKKIITYLKTKHRQCVNFEEALCFGD